MTTVKTKNNITSLEIYGLVKGSNYSFTVKSIDKDGETGNSTKFAYLLFDGK